MGRRLMSSPNKIRGNNFERLIVKKFTEAGHDAKRAWGSNGKAMGEHEEVDVLVNIQFSDKNYCDKLKIQCKSRKKLPQFLGLSEHVDAVVFKEKAGKTYIMIELDLFIKDFL